MKLPVSRTLPLVALIVLGAGSALAKDRIEPQTAPLTGPAADYPVVVGEPFSIGSTVWTPTDQLNYDAVGYASIGGASLAGVTGAHKTLPLPSYVEVTALGTGKTILVRLERRGPMINDVLIELSPAAASQLGIAPDGHAQVRVRRVNPPEQERAMLRMNGKAPERMETPEGLLKVLRRKLAEQAPLLPPPSTPPQMPVAASASDTTLSPSPKSKTAAPKVSGVKLSQGEKTVVPSPVPFAAATPKEPRADVTHPAPFADRPGVPGKAGVLKPSVPEKGSLAVQVAALSVEANARRLADQLGGNVYHSGKLWHVRMGPFANRAQAAAALEKAKHAGYRDARIQSAN